MTDHHATAQALALSLDFASRYAAQVAVGRIQEALEEAEEAGVAKEQARLKAALKEHESRNRL